MNRSEYNTVLVAGAIIGWILALTVATAVALFLVPKFCS
jgi:hypothetical protein